VVNKVLVDHRVGIVIDGQPVPDKDCYWDQGYFALTEQEYREPRRETRGRKKGSNLNDEDRKKRFRILARHGAIVQRINKELDGLNRMEKLIHLGGLINKCKEQIDPLVVVLKVVRRFIMKSIPKMYVLSILNEKVTTCPYM